MSAKNVIIILAGGAFVALWSVALWRRWPELVYEKRIEGATWFWLSLFRIPTTKENCVRFGRICCVAGIVLVTTGVLVGIYLG